MRLSRGFAVLARLAMFAVLAGHSSQAHAESGETLPFSIGYGGEGYQRGLIEHALKANHLNVAPDPEGKTIERIVVVPFDVITQEEPWPQFLNWFHSTTKPYVIQRELLFKEGDAWNTSRVRETARNMRSYLFITAATVTPVQGSRPDRVVALVVTKDMWSLRTDFSFSYVGSIIEAFDLQASEQNLTGRMKQITADVGFNIASAYAGQQYRDPRLLGSQLLLQERGDLIWNRSSGRLEGGVANLSLNQPLYTLDTPWSWGGSLNFRNDIYRLFSNGAIAAIRAPSTGEALPYAFNRRLLDFQAGVTRSLGRERKRNISAGYRAFTHTFSMLAAPGPVQSATVNQVQASILPRSENVGQLYFGYRAYQAEFKELLDLNTYALTEDTRIGYDLSAELRYANPALGFSSTFFEPVLGASWTFYGGEDLFRVGSSLDIRYQPQLSTESPWANGELTIFARNVTPKLRFFRLHTAFEATRRYNNVDRSFSTLGANNSLRGYPSSYLMGTNLWLGNIEARSIPLVLATMHIGIATFMDIGSAADRVSDLTPHASVGAGLRIALPQFNREVIRVDLGFPLERLVGADPAYVVAQFGQAF